MARDWKLRTLQADQLDRLRPQTLFSLKGKVAVVTGAGGGLGAWLPAGLAAAGADLLLTDHPRSLLKRLLQSSANWVCARVNTSAIYWTMMRRSALSRRQ